MTISNTIGNTMISSRRSERSVSMASAGGASVFGQRARKGLDEVGDSGNLVRTQRS
jgi:hypothetical protein